MRVVARRTGDPRCAPAPADPGSGCLPLHDRAAAGDAAGVDGGGRQGAGVRRATLLPGRPARSRGRRAERAGVLPRGHHRHDHADAQALRGGAQGAGTGALPRADQQVRGREPLLPRAARSHRRQAAAALARHRGAAALGAWQHRQARRPRQDDSARAVDGRAERRRSGADGGSRRLPSDAQGPRGAGAPGARRVGAAAHPREPDAGKRDRDPGGAVADPEPARARRCPRPSATTTCASSCDRSSTSSATATARRGDGGAAQQGDAGRVAEEARVEAEKQVRRSIRCTPRAPRPACCGRTSSG